MVTDYRKLAGGVQARRGRLPSRWCHMLLLKAVRFVDLISIGLRLQSFHRVLIEVF